MIANLKVGDSVVRVGPDTELLFKGQEYVVSEIDPNGWHDTLRLDELPDNIFTDSGFTLASPTSEDLPDRDPEEGWWTTNFTGAAHGLSDTYLEQMGLEYRVQLRRKR